MPTISIPTYHTTSPTTPARMRSVDRFAMQFGIAMIRWAEHSDEQRARRMAAQVERTGRSHRIARQQAEDDRERAEQRATTMFWNVR